MPSKLTWERMVQLINILLNVNDNLKNRLYHIVLVIEKQISEEISANRLRLKTLIDVVRWLAFQSYPFRGHDESAKSMNQGNFLEIVDLLAYNEEVKVVVLSNALLCAGFAGSTTGQLLRYLFGGIHVCQWCQNSIKGLLE